jgi:hypothetical protein
MWSQEYVLNVTVLPKVKKVKQSLYTPWRRREERRGGRAPTHS